MQAQSTANRELFDLLAREQVLATIRRIGVPANSTSGSMSPTATRERRCTMVDDLHILGK